MRWLLAIFFLAVPRISRGEDVPVAAPPGLQPPASVPGTEMERNEALAAAQSLWRVRDSREGSLYLYWGYNRAAYSNSSISFSGPGYRFRLDGVRGIDHPGWDARGAVNYIFREPPTVPQFNARIGVYLSNTFRFSIGLDHMKYDMVDALRNGVGQNVSITGTIDKSVSAAHAGTYNNAQITVGRPGDIVTRLWHHNGLNYVDLEAGWSDDFLRIGAFRLVGTGAVSVGPVLTHSEIDMLGQTAAFFGGQRFHLSGFGGAASVSMRAELFVFVEAQAKAGWIDLVNFVAIEGGSASQNLWFAEGTIAFGLHL